MPAAAPAGIRSHACHRKMLAMSCRPQTQRHVGERVLRAAVYSTHGRPDRASREQASKDEQRLQQGWLPTCWPSTTRTTCRAGTPSLSTHPLSRNVAFTFCGSGKQ